MRTARLTQGVIPRLDRKQCPSVTGEVEVEPYIVTDFIEGPTLRQWREKRDRVELDEAIAATRELIEILNKCQEAGLVHRDVKPDNIILARR